MAKRSTSRGRMVGCMGPHPAGAEVATSDTLHFPRAAALAQPSCHLELPDEKNSAKQQHPVPGDPLEHNPQITVKRNRVNWS